MAPEKIFHISEEGDIKTFHPRPSPSKFDQLDCDVVFGILDRLLHNYLFPRDCPRVTYYAGPNSTQADKDRFLQTGADFVLAVEAKWVPILQQTVLYCYEFNPNAFTLLDECAGYYVADQPVMPITVTRIDNILQTLLQRSDVELRILPELHTLADQVVCSTLHFSLIRMRNAQPREMK